MKRDPVNDPLNDMILPLIGAVILALLWWNGYLPWKAIKFILFE